MSFPSKSGAGKSVPMQMEVQKMFKKSDNQGDKPPKQAEVKGSEKAPAAANEAAKAEETTTPATAEVKKA